MRFHLVALRWRGDTHTSTAGTYNTGTHTERPVVTVAVHASASKLALEPHPVEASEDAGTVKFALNKFAFIPKKEKKNPIKTAEIPRLLL